MAVGQTALRLWLRRERIESLCLIPAGELLGTGLPSNCFAAPRQPILPAWCAPDLIRDSDSGYRLFGVLFNTKLVLSSLTRGETCRIMQNRQAHVGETGHGCIYVNDPSEAETLISSLTSR